MNHEVLYADSVELCDRALRIVQDAKVVGVDTESVGPDLSDFSPVGKHRAVSIQFATNRPSDPWVFVPLWGDYQDNLLVFKKWLEDSRQSKVLHNAKHDAHVLANEGIRFDGLLADTMVMDFLWDSGAMSHALKECVKRYFNDEGATSYGETFKVPVLNKNGQPSKSRTRLMDLNEVIGSDKQRLVDYAVKDPAYTVKLFEFLKNKMSSVKWAGSENYYDYYRKFEVPFTNVLYRMERRGCLLDTSRLSKLNEDIESDIDALENEFVCSCVEFGVPQKFMLDFNMGSPKQVAQLIEGFLGIRITERTEKGAPSTSKDSLESLKASGPAKRILSLLLEMRRLSVFHGTFTSKLSEYAGMYNGRAHTSFRQIGAATMRLSSSAPNLMNIPTSSKDHYGIRECFVAPKGMVVGDIDLSQIELRLTAHFTRDPVMIEYIRDGKDLHSLTASRTSVEVKRWMAENGKKVDNDTLEYIKKHFGQARAFAKVLNFGQPLSRAEVKFPQNGELFARKRMTTPCCVARRSVSTCGPTSGLLSKAAGSSCLASHAASFADTGNTYQE